MIEHFFKNMHLTNVFQIVAKFIYDVICFFDFLRNTSGENEYLLEIFY